MSKTRDITVTVNGEAFAAAVEPRLLLADFLRHTLGLTGTHVGCDTASAAPAPCFSTATACAPA
jgi:aerobic-type carbon monoxide dehydrogenase small subunit (CoxS/CutS family)